MSQSKGVVRRRPGSTGFDIFSSELNVNGYSFKRSNSLFDKGQLFKAREGRFSHMRVISLGRYMYSSLFLKICLLQQSVRSG